MARECVNCKKKVGLIVREAPLELGDDKIFCAECAESLRPMLRKWHDALTGNLDYNEIQTVKEQILQNCQKIYSKNAVEAIEKKLDKIYQDERKHYIGKSSSVKYTQQPSKSEQQRLSENESDYQRTVEKIAQIEKARNQILTTGYNFEGYNIVKYIGIISGETVLGAGFLSEFSASFSDILGDESSAFTDKLEAAKNTALDKLSVKSMEKGGNAIIGIDFDYITFSNNMIGVVANGTSVVIEKIE